MLNPRTSILQPIFRMLKPNQLTTVFLPVRPCSQKVFPPIPIHINPRTRMVEVSLLKWRDHCSVTMFLRVVLVHLSDVNAAVFFTFVACTVRDLDRVEAKHILRHGFHVVRPAQVAYVQFKLF